MTMLVRSRGRESPLGLVDFYHRAHGASSPNFRLRTTKRTSKTSQRMQTIERANRGYDNQSQWNCRDRSPWRREVSRISSSAFGRSTFGRRGRLSHITARMISTTDEVLTSPRKYMPNIKLKTRTTSKTRGRATDPRETILHTYD